MVASLRGGLVQQAGLPSSDRDHVFPFLDSRTESKNRWTRFERAKKASLVASVGAHVRLCMVRWCPSTILTPLWSGITPEMRVLA